MIKLEKQTLSFKCENCGCEFGIMDSDDDSTTIECRDCGKEETIYD